MSYIEYLQKTIDYIEENIKQPISTEACAEAAGFSKYHFYRLFTLFVGVPLMEYVRKRKLYYAMKDVNSGKRIIDIALDYGYSSERTFERAFQKEFKASPSKFRNKLYAIPEKPVLKEDKFIILGGLNMEYSFSEVTTKELEDMYVARAQVISENPENDVIGFITKWMEKNNIDLVKSRQFGFDIPVSEEQRDKGLRGYEYWIKVDKNVKLQEGITLKKVDRGTYAVLRITNPFSNPFEAIPAGWKKLCAWVESKGYNHNSTKGSKERYWLEEKRQEDGEVNMEIYFPID